MAYIFKRDGTVWTEQARLTAADGIAVDQFGHSVSISGDYAIVGIYHVEGPTPSTFPGKAYVFKRNGTSWVQEQVLTATDAAADDLFGSNVCLSGNYAIVGAPKKDVGTNSDQGKVYIFNRAGTNWVQQATFIDNNGTANAKLGLCVNINGDYAVAGSSLNRKALIFYRLGGTWSQQATVTSPPDIDANRGFGHSVSISSEYLVVGANEAKIGTNLRQGKAYIYKRNGTSWLQQAALTSSDGLNDDRFSGATSISGTNIIIAAPDKNYPPGATNAGKVYFFTQQ
jgi:hypothetical protein